MVKKSKLFEPSNEEKAFVYQQTQDLVNSHNLGPISVLLEKKESSSQFVITFVFNTGLFQIAAQSEGENLHETCISAKNEMKKKLSVLSQSLNDSKERDQFIEELKKNPYIH